MARPKKSDDKLKAAPLPVAAPPMMLPHQQPLQPISQAHVIAPVMPHLQQVQPIQQQPIQRVIDSENFSRVRDSVSTIL